MEITASNAIFLGEETGGKGRQFKARFLVPGLVKYDYGVCLLTKENADKFIQGFTGCPVVINHQDVTDENAKDVRVGVIYSVWFDEKDGYFWCKGVIWDKEAIKLINEGYSVSCQYVITEYSDNTEGKLHNGNPYDKVIENGRPEHLAIVNNPRYEGAIIAVNAIMAQNEDKWITIHPNGEDAKGRHLLIKDGQTKKEAIQEKIKEWEDNSEKEDKHPSSDFFKKLEEQHRTMQKDASEKEKSKLLDKERLKKYKEVYEKNKKWLRDNKDLSEVERETAKAKQEKLLDEIEKMEKAQTAANSIPALIADTIADTLAEGVIESLNAINRSDWKESDHPRDEQGKFTSGQSGADSNKNNDRMSSILYTELPQAEKELKDLKTSARKSKESGNWTQEQEIDLNKKTNKLKSKINSLKKEMEWLRNSKEISIKKDQPIYSTSEEYRDKIEKAAESIDIDWKEWLINKHKKSAKNSIPDLIADTIADTLAEGIIEFIASNEDKWITIKPNGEDAKGRHLLIKDGQTKKEAIQEKIKEWEDNSEKEDKHPSSDFFKKLEEQHRTMQKDASEKEKSKLLDKERLKKHLEEMRKTRKDFKELTADFLNDIKTNDKTEYKKVMELIKKYFVTVKFLEKRGLLDKKEEIDRIPDYLNSDLKYTPEGEKLREFASKHGKTYGNLIKSIYELQKRKTASNSFIDELFDTLYKEFADRLGE